MFFFKLELFLYYFAVSLIMWSVYLSYLSQ